MPHPVTTALLALAVATLAGCGQMGPLYMPAEESPQGAAAEKTQSAPPPSEES